MSVIYEFSVDLTKEYNSISCTRSHERTCDPLCYSLNSDYVHSIALCLLAKHEIRHCFCESLHTVQTFHRCRLILG